MQLGMVSLGMAGVGVKFCDELAPHIHGSWKEDQGEAHLYACSDNLIGVCQCYCYQFGCSRCKDVFSIRLHYVSPIEPVREERGS